MIGQLQQGEVIADRFVLQRLLGEGGMGAVWAATHRITRKDVALKFLKAKGGDDSQMQRRFLREARAASAVHHPNVVQVHDIVTLPDGSPVMVMDLLLGESLGARLARCKRLEVRDMVDLLVPVVSAVGTAHAAGIVHRDLKPDNIFLEQGPDGSVIPKVLDFGIAKISNPEGEVPASSKLTQTGAMMGTPFYMAPEQAFGESDVDHRVDIWALGVIVYECLAGRKPVDGENLGQLLRVLTTGDIASLSVVAPDVPHDLVVLVNRMLSIRKEQRPSDLREVFQTLRTHAAVSASSFEGALPPRASLPAVVTGDTASMPFAETQVASSHTASRSRPPQASRRALWLVIGTVLVAASGAAFIARRPQSLQVVSSNVASTYVSAATPLTPATLPALAASLAGPDAAPPGAPSSSESLPKVTIGRQPSKSSNSSRPPSASATPSSPPTPAQSALPGGVVPEVPF